MLAVGVAVVEELRRNDIVVVNDFTVLKRLCDPERTAIILAAVAVQINTGKLVVAHAGAAVCVAEGQYLLSYVNDVVVITKGSDGAVAYHKKEKYSDKYVTKAIDSVGAGDAFNAGFLSAYVHKLPIEVCLSYGCACGSTAVQKVGGGIPMSWEILTASVKDHMTKRGSTSNF